MDEIVGMFSKILLTIGAVFATLYHVFKNTINGRVKSIEDEIIIRELELDRVREEAQELESMSVDDDSESEQLLEDLKNKITSEKSEIENLSDEEVIDNLRDRGF